MTNGDSMSFGNGALLRTLRCAARGWMNDNDSSRSTFFKNRIKNHPPPSQRPNLAPNPILHP